MRISIDRISAHISRMDSRGLGSADNQQKMKKINIILSGKISRLVLVLFLFVIGKVTFTQQKINLDASMFYNFSTKGDASLWVDEQQLANDPASGNAGQPVTVFSPGWINADIYYPAMIVLDLGKAYSISSLWLFDVNDSDSLHIFTGTPAIWVKKAGILLNTYNNWRELPINTTSRFLMFRIPGPSTRVAEIVVYGTPVGQSSEPPLPVQHISPLMQHFMGVNGFINDPIDKLSCVGNVREYHNWGWDEGNTTTDYRGYPNNQYAWNPSWVSGPGWGFYFDDFYTDLKSNKLIVSPDLQGAAPYITGFDDSLTQHKPLSLGENPLLPFSYIEHADYMFQFAARYGKTPVNASLLKLKADQQPKSGTSLINYIENWNEPDKWWFTRGGYFTPDEFATMCSADYDGHNGALGATKGMKVADPQVKMVMGGLASLNLEYVRCMKLWSDFNRQNGFPSDVLNFHHYSENGTHGISPEADNLKLKLKTIVEYRNTFLPGKEIWLSEFGYDTQPESVQAAVVIDTNDIYEVQGQWIMRSFLEAAAAGIDKAFVFMLRDANALDPNKYNSSGLTNEIWNGHQPKKSWFYVNTMSKQLENTRFSSEIATGNTEVNAYKFTSVTSDTIVYAVWCSTSNNTVVQNVELNVGVSGSVKMILPANGQPLGIESLLPIQSGKVRFRVTERPVFIRTTGNKKVRVTGMLRFFNQNATPLPQEAHDLKVQLFDSQNVAVTEVISLEQTENSFVFSVDSLAVEQIFKLRLWESSQSGLLSDTWLWNSWTGVSALDALIISYLVVESPVLEQLPWIGEPTNPDFFISQLADVNNNGSLTALDALMVAYRSIGFPGMSPFPGGRHNYIIGGNFDNSLTESVFPDSPELIFTPFGNFSSEAPATTIYYETTFPALSEGAHFFNIYFGVAGDMNLSAGL